jgi:hypothetical protein
VRVRVAEVLRGVLTALPSARGTCSLACKTMAENCAEQVGRKNMGKDGSRWGHLVLGGAGGLVGDVNFGAVRALKKLRHLRRASLK